MRILALLFVALMAAGCSGGTRSTAASAGTAPPNPVLTDTLVSYMSQALPPALIQQMQNDRNRLGGSFPVGVNAFSTAQYGTRLVTGTADLGDVFDARIPANAAAFQAWAAQQGLVACDPPSEHVMLYSDAAIAFMREFQYDAVLYFPDEFHPVFTHPADTWLFLREEPPAGVQPGEFFTSSRLTRRTIRLGGGVPMGPSPLVGFFYFYFPTTDEPYASYRLFDGPEISTLPRPPYTPVVGDAAAIQARQAAGLVDTPLSGEVAVPLATWMGPGAATHAVENGPRIGDDPDIYTWSDIGEYYLVLDSDYWVVPPGGAPSINGGTVP